MPWYEIWGWFILISFASVPLLALWWLLSACVAVGGWFHRTFLYPREDALQSQRAYAEWMNQSHIIAPPRGDPTRPDGEPLLELWDDEIDKTA